MVVSVTEMGKLREEDIRVQLKGIGKFEMLTRHLNGGVK